MTLIEVLLEYQRIFRTYSETKAYEWLRGACDPRLWDDIRDTFSRHGNFVDADGGIIYLVCGEREPL